MKNMHRGKVEHAMMKVENERAAIVKKIIERDPSVMKYVTTEDKASTEIDVMGISLFFVHDVLEVLLSLEYAFHACE